MLPMVQLLSDGQQWSRRDMNARLAEVMDVTEQDRLLTLKSGRQTLWDNRCGWAVTYLTKANLVFRPKRATYEIAERGREALANGVPRIDSKYLRRFPETRAFENRETPDLVIPPDPEREPEQQTPDELIGIGFERFQAALEDDMLARVRTVSPGFFERLDVELLVAMGYGGTFEDAASVVGKTGDGGIDGVIKEDRLGLDTIHVQAKRWQHSVGRPVVAEFVGNLAPHQSRKGVLITTSTFTQDATRYVQQLGQRVVLIDGQQLATLMVEHGVGVTPLRTYTLKRIDNDYFDEES